MGSVNSINPGAASLLQFVSSAASPSLSSSLSSAAVQAALKSASPEDLVKLSQAALESQVASGLFGSSVPQQTTTDPFTLLLQAVTSSITGSTTSGSTAAPTSAAALQSQQVSELFGTTSTEGTANSAISLIG